jgi:hypothetical protein
VEPRRLIGLAHRGHVGGTWLKFWLKCPRVSPASENQDGSRKPVTWGFVGAACRNRTDDLLITSETLCRLS